MALAGLNGRMPDWRLKIVLPIAILRPRWRWLGLERSSAHSLIKHNSPSGIHRCANTAACTVMSHSQYRAAVTISI